MKDLINELVDKGVLIGDPNLGYKINPYLEMPKSLGYEDVAIAQGRANVSSRSEVSTKSEVMRGLTLDVPLMSANMSSVTNACFAREMEKQGALGVIHRAFPREGDYLNEIAWARYQAGMKNVAASIGVGPKQIELARELITVGANIVFIDVAHGYSQAVYDTAKAVKEYAPKVKVVVGNTNNPEMMYEFDDVADAVKVGIAQGLVCETKDTSGVTEKMFSSVIKFKDVSKKLGLPIIADGGIRLPSDFSKAIAAGANSIMAGSIFARCPESAGKVTDEDGSVKKIYMGMASRDVQMEWRGSVSNDCPEGKTMYLDLGERLPELVARYMGALRSGVSYVGADDISSFQEKVKFIRI